MNEELQTAIVIESFRKDIEYIKVQLTSLVQNQDKFASKDALNDFRKDFNAHLLDDKENFEKLIKGQDKINLLIAKWTSVLAVIVFLVNILVPIISHYWLGF